MDKENFLIKFLKFSGWLEIAIGILFFFMDIILTYLGIPNLALFSLSSGVMMIILGFLLWFSARDVKRYLIIPVTSCIFRYAMALGPELYTMITIPIFIPILIGGMIYDIFSATLTLMLLKQQNYL